MGILYTSRFTFHVSRIPVVCLILSAALLNSCALIGSVGIKRPHVGFAGAKLDKLSFDSADFLFDLRMQNPNHLSIKLAGLDYDFLINGSSFLSGKDEEGLEIPANGEDTIQLPLSLRFVDLYRAVQSLQDQDESTYQLNCGFSFNLPILGTVRIPVSKTGDFPLLKLPVVNLDALQLTRLDLFGAELKLGIRVKNSNPFAMILDRFQYQFEVNGQNWVAGEAKIASEVTEKGESQIEIPISLNFLKVGRSVYQMLQGKPNLDYQFKGSLDLRTSHALLGKVTLPFDRFGQIEVRR